MKTPSLTAGKTTYDVLVAGEINPDLILTGDVEPVFGQVEKLVDSATLTIGSSSAIFACGAARLGLEVAFIGLCGEDVFGCFMIDEMRKRGIDVNPIVVRTEGQTGLSVILNRGADRAILTNPGLIPHLKASDIPDNLLSKARHLHVSSYFLQTALQPGLVELFQRAHNYGLTTSLDTNYDPSGRWIGFDQLLSVTDLFFPNEKEVLSLSREENLGLAMSKLGTLVKVLAVKLGETGAICLQNGQLVSCPSIPVKLVDTVGAGDSFDAGFLYGHLHGWGLEDTVCLACICGSLSTREAGGTDGQPTLEEALSYLHQGKPKRGELP